MESTLWPLQRKLILVREEYWVGWWGLVKRGDKGVFQSIGFTWESFLGEC